MFDRNPSLRGSGEKIPYTQEMINEYIRCKEDIIYFAENYFYIQNQKKGKIKIPLYGFQKKMLKAFVDPSPYDHLITLSARQSGKCLNFKELVRVTQKPQNSLKIEDSYEIMLGDLFILESILSKTLTSGKLETIYRIVMLVVCSLGFKYDYYKMRCLWKKHCWVSLWSSIKILLSRMQGQS